MAYPTVTGPYGLVPLNLIGGHPFAGSTRMIPIASGYSTSLYFGDPVKFTSDGSLIQSGLAYNSAATETGGTLGVFLGCEYSPASGPLFGKLRAQKWTAGTVASDAVAYVCDDPQIVMKVALVAYATGASTTMAAASPSVLGTNLTTVVASTANDGTKANLNGNSNIGAMLASGNVRRTTTAPLRVVGLVDETKLVIAAVAGTTNANTAVTLAAANSDIKVGMAISGTGIAAGTVVAAVSGTSVTLSANATATNTAVTLTFTGYQEVLVKWNAGYHAYENAVAI